MPMSLSVTVCLYALAIGTNCHKISHPLRSPIYQYSCPQWYPLPSIQSPPNDKLILDLLIHWWDRRVIILAVVCHHLDDKGK